MTAFASRPACSSSTDRPLATGHRSCRRSAPRTSIAHRVIQSHALEGALWVLIADAHADLVTTQQNGPTAQRMAEIRDELAALHSRLGDVLRGIYHGLTAQEHLARDPAVSAAARKLRRKMFPDKLMATRKSYRGQAGQAMLLETRLSDGDRELLQRLSTLEGVSFANAVDEWFEIAASMGALEDERAGDAHRVITAADVSAARNRWIRAVRAFITALRLRQDVPGELLVILDRLERAGQQAARRRAQARTEPEQPAGPPAGPPAGAPAGKEPFAAPPSPPTPATRAQPRAPDPISARDRGRVGPAPPAATG